MNSLIRKTVIEYPRKKDFQIKARGYKWSPTEQGATLVWRDVCVYAPQPDKKQSIKRIINNASGAVTPGMLVALMGSSGAGKSTLMSALAHRSPGNTKKNTILDPKYYILIIYF